MDLHRFPWSSAEVIPDLWEAVRLGELFLFQVKRSLGLANEGTRVPVSKLGRQLRHERR